MGKVIEVRKTDHIFFPFSGSKNRKNGFISHGLCSLFRLFTSGIGSNLRMIKEMEIVISRDDYGFIRVVIFKSRSHGHKIPRVESRDGRMTYGIRNTPCRKPKPEAQEQHTCSCHSHQPERRAFLKSATGLIGAGVALSLGAVLGVSAVGPTLENQSPQWVNAGNEKDFPVGGITSVTLSYPRKQAFHVENKEVPVLVRRDSDKDFICFSSSCPHLGCAVSWDELSRRFKCACHGGAFDRDGNVIAGPPPAPLARLPWKLEDGILKVEVV